MEDQSSLGWYLSTTGGAVERRFDPSRELQVQVKEAGDRHISEGLGFGFSPARLRIKFSIVTNQPFAVL